MSPDLDSDQFVINSLRFIQTAPTATVKDMIKDCDQALTSLKTSSYKKAGLLIVRGMAKSKTGDRTGAKTDLEAVLAMKEGPDDYLRGLVNKVLKII